MTTEKPDGMIITKPVHSSAPAPKGDNMAAKRATLKDVAERSGYALRTVKNVVAGKSSVGGPVREAVLRAMEELNYKQNSLASTLAKNRVYLIAVILPQIDTAFQDELSQGIRRYADGFEDFGLDLEMHYTEPTVHAQMRLLEEFYEREDVDGILLQPVCETGLNAQIDLLVYGNKPVFTVGLDAPDSKRICFVGPDYCRSGRIAAQLMANYIGRAGTVLVIHRGSSRLRRDGFQELMVKQYPNVQIASLCLTDNEPENIALLKDQLRNPQLRGIFDADDNLPQLGALLQEMDRGEAVLMGCSFTEEISSLMRGGWIDAVISQEPKDIGYTAMDTLFQYLSRSKHSPKRVYTPLTILTSECL